MSDSFLSAAAARSRDATEQPAGQMMAGRNKPEPLRMAGLGEPSNQGSPINSSPLDAALMARKAERQGEGVGSLLASSPRPDGTCDSPGWQTNFSRIKEDSDPRNNNSSPQGSALLRKKIERQQHAEGRPTPLQASSPRPDGTCDSPGWQTNFSRIKEDSDPRNNNSSPQGSALLRKKIERQRHAEGRPTPNSGESELQQPARRPPGSDQLQPPSPLQKPTIPS